MNMGQMQFPVNGAPIMVPNFTSVLTQRLSRDQPAGIPMNSALAWAQAGSSAGGSRSQPGLDGLPQGTRGNQRVQQEEDDAPRRKRRKRDPTLPTPARFAWNFFFRDQYTKIRNSEPGEHSNVQKAFTDIGLDLGKKWKSLTKEEKAPYIRMAEQDRERYDREMRQRLSGISSLPSQGGLDDSALQGSEMEGDASDADDEEKVGILFHEVEVEDTRE